VVRKLIFLFLLLCATSAIAAADTFIKIGGFAGKSTDPEHLGWIVPSSFSWGGGAASQFSQRKATFTLSDPPAGWSAQFMQLAAKGSHLGTVLVDIGLMRASLDDAIVASAKPGFEIDSMHQPLLTVTLDFANSTTTTKPSPHAGTVRPPIGAVAAASNAGVTALTAPPNAQIFFDGMPGERFDLLGLSVRGKTAVLSLREPRNGTIGMMAKARGSSSKVAVVKENITFVFSSVKWSYTEQKPDGSETVTLDFASYAGPAGGLRQ
jgi:hypothetical protein